jgi:uncharacterized membrane protein
LELTVKALLVGESWFTFSLHQKGFDTFQTAEYHEGGTAFIESLVSHDINVAYVRAHEVSMQFPRTPEELMGVGVVILSDVGSNTFLLAPETFTSSRPAPNRLVLIRDYVAAGGSLLMVGGYMSFQGIDGRARYSSSPLAEVLPVDLLETDDRVEVPEGIHPQVVAKDHFVVDGLSTTWPQLLGYNRFRPKADALVVATIGKDPLLVLGTYGRGRVAAFASDIAPHWAPPEFMQWHGYGQLWSCLIRWLAQQER